MKWRLIHVVVLCSLHIGVIAQSNSWYEQGTKVDGKKVGIWNYFDSPDNLALTYDHTSDSVVFIVKDTTRSLIKKHDDWVPTLTDYTARVLGSYEPLYAYLQGTITSYTKSILKKRQYFSDKVYVAFSINQHGKMEDVTVLNSSNDDLNQKLLSAIIAAPFEWLAARKDGQPTSSIVAIPIVFCADCESFMPRNTIVEKIPLPCPVLPILVIQKESLKSGGYKESRSQVIDPNRRSRNLRDGLNYEHAEWSKDGSRIAFIHKDNLFEHHCKSGLTKQITRSTNSKSCISEIPEGWLFHQENNFGVEEIWLSNTRVDSVWNLSKEIKWSEAHPMYNPGDSLIYFVGSKGNGEVLISIQPRSAVKSRVFQGASWRRRTYEDFMINDRSIAHLEYQELHLPKQLPQLLNDNALCIREGSGRHDLITDYTRNLELAEWSPDGRYIIYSIKADGVYSLYQVDLQTKEKLMLPILNDFPMGWIGQKAVFIIHHQYKAQADLYLYDPSKAKLETIGSLNRDFNFLSHQRNNNALLIESNNTVYNFKLVPESKPEKLFENAFFPLRQPNGDLVYYIDSKSGEPRLFNMNTAQSTAISIPGIDSKLPSSRSYSRN